MMSKRSTLRAFTAVFALLWTFQTASAQSTRSYKGCYEVDSSLSLNDTYTYQSYGHCLGQCQSMGQSVLGMTGGSDCYCGDEIPGTKVDDSYCDTSCVGYPSDTCGGSSYWSVYLTGTGSNPSTASGSSSSSSYTSSSVASRTSSDSSSPKESSDTASSTATSTTSTGADATPSVVYITTGGSTVTATPTATASSSADSANTSTTSSGKSSGGGGGVSAGAIAGIVVGVVLGSLLLGLGAFFFWRRRRNSSFEDISSVGPSSPPRAAAMPDPRLEPAMVQRRLSEGSLADEQDYTRKILRVVNA
ncbi:hypothetical protein G7K_4938-t1 [Saitoella complicata NRRL Y-17804]|uniref:WSC domain-containing protein n=1 Tax=Saitoella complicata (strain BCRC 22490 / CBS 7301 / JCM 7358 / NBRC 10748 / NRRL Y-17804) TaxID=698492 RepID=A0A0E9NLQ8_SAICN|nr:hypothetical protein G7K_4938-t1 [Saitoella complicata NRRL Y-17804]